MKRTKPNGKAIPTHFPCNSQKGTSQGRPPAGSNAPDTGNLVPSTLMLSSVRPKGQRARQLLTLLTHQWGGRGGWNLRNRPQ